MNHLKSLNNRLILESYKVDRTIRTNNSTGFASIDQKTQVVGLKLLVDFESNGSVFRKGSVAFIKEELLFAQPWAKKTYQSEAIEGDFLIVDSAYVEFISEKQAPQMED